MSRLRFTILAVVVLSATLMPYLPTLYAPFIWDDVELIETSPVLGTPGVLQRSFSKGFFYTNRPLDGPLYYRPLTTLTLEFDRMIHGTTATGYHGTNILLHVISVLALMLLALRIGFTREMVLWIGAFFAVHPSHVLPVGNVSYRSVTLCAAAMWFGYVMILKKEVSVWRIAGGCILVMMAMLSRETALLAPLFFVAMIPAITHRLIPNRKTVFRIVLPLTVLAVGMFVLRTIVIGSGVGGTRGLYPDRAVTWQLFVESAARGLRYLLWPIRMEIIQAAEPVGAAMTVTGAGALLLVIVLWFVFRKSSAATGIAWMFMGMAPLMALAVTFGNQNPAYVFIGSAGMAMVLVSLLWRMKRRWLSRLVLALIIVWFGLISMAQSAAMMSDRTFWERAVADSPEQDVLLNNLGRARAREGDAQGAMAAWKKALEINPGSAKALANMGILAMNMRQWPEAIRCFTSVRTMMPGDTMIRWRLAAAYFGAGRTDEARNEITQVLEMPAGEQPMPTVRARLLLELGFGEAAVTAAREAVERAPGDPGFQVNLAFVLMQTGHLDEADKILAGILTKSPGYTLAWNRMAQLEILRGNPAEAIACFDKILTLEPDNEHALKRRSQLQAEVDTQPAE